MSTGGLGDRELARVTLGIEELELVDKASRMETLGDGRASVGLGRVPPEGTEI